MRLDEVTNDRDLISTLEAIRMERLNNRAPFEETWWNNIALVAGDHYAVYEPDRAGFITPKVEKHKVQLVLNQARVVARTELAKMTKSRPIMDVIANSNDDQDIAATRVGRFALDAAEWKFKLRKRRKSALWWTIITGVSGMYVGYDPTDAKDGHMEFYIDPATSEPTFDPERIAQLKEDEEAGLIELKKESWPLGDIEYRIYSPFQMLPDDTVLEWEDIADIIVTDIVDIGKARRSWGKKARDLTPEIGQPGGFGQRMLRRIGLTTGTLLTEPSTQTVNIHTYWLKPGVYNTPYLKDGLMVRWANKSNMLEISRPFPFIDKRLPFAFFTHVPNAVSIWPDTVLTDVRPINLELDKTISQLLENRDYMLNPMWRIPEQCQVRKIKSQPGGEVRYVHVRDVPPPEQIPGVPMPTQIENLVVGLRDQILDISGMGEVSRGRVPSGVRAGNMLAFLQEEDESKIAPTVENFEDGIAMEASLTLCRFAQFYHVNRLLRAYKPGGQADIRKFKGADLKNNTDVVVQAGSALPKLKAARQQYVMQLAELGIEKDPKRIRDMLELGEGEPDEVDLAFAQADRENEIMMGLGMQSPTAPAKPELAPTSNDLQAGAPSSENSMAVPVKKWHNHEAHLKRHYRYMSTADFERLQISHPDIVRVFDEHTTAHEEAMKQIQMQQIQMMLAARGGPEATAPGEGQMPMDPAAEAAQRSA